MTVQTMTRCNAHIATMLRPGDGAYRETARPDSANERRRLRRLAARGGVTKRDLARAEVLCSAMVPGFATVCPACGSESPRVKAERAVPRMTKFYEKWGRGESDVEAAAAKNGAKPPCLRSGEC